MTLECRVPISPRPAWLNRTRLIAASLRRFYPDSIVRAYVGDPAGATPGNVRMVADALVDIDIEWIDQHDFDAWAGTRSEYLATMNARFQAPIIGDYMLILDADVICTKPFDELFEVDAIQGVQAHVPPVRDEDWSILFGLLGMQAPALIHPYTGGGIMCLPEHRGPWYVNSGAVFGPRHLFERLCEPYHEAIARMRLMLADTYWFDQLALALAVAKSGVPARSLPLRYNFPNQANFDATYPDELSDIRFLHYLRTDLVHRDRDFEDASALTDLLRRTDLTGSNKVLQDAVRESLPVLEAVPV